MQQRKPPLYRKVNTTTHGVRHLHGGDFKDERKTKAYLRSDAVHQSMHGNHRRGLDYTPLFKFLLSIQSALNNDEVLVKLTAIIEARNCIVHSAAVVPDDKKALRLRAYAIHHSPGDRLHLKNNLLEDFLHYMGIHIVAFIKRLP